MKHRNRKTDEVIVSYGSIHQLSEPDDEPPDRDGTAYDGVEQVSPKLWIGLAWAIPASFAIVAFVAWLLYLFCDSCRSIW